VGIDGTRPWELLLAVDPAADGTLRRQLEARLREAVRSGALPGGARLPSTRTLAAQLGVSRGVVIDAYDQLAHEGVVELRPRAAPRIAPGLGERRDAPDLPALAPGPRYDFSATSPDLTLFPRTAWRRALDQALMALPDSALDYGDPRGALELRVQLSRYLGRVRGVIAPPEAIMVVNGFTQALDLVTRLLAARGARAVAIEDPCLEDEPIACARAGLDVIALPVDEDGARIESLVDQDADAAIVAPAHQYPTGTVLAPERRRALLDWARAGERLVVEDDYDAEFRYDRRPVGALQAMAPDRVVYTGSASKTFAPGLRLGWLAVPPELIDPLTELKWFVDGGSPALAQHAYATLLRDGAVDRHLQRARAHYRVRRDRLAQELVARFPDGRVGGIAAGLHLVLRPGFPLDPGRLATAAAEDDVRVELVAAHAHHPRLADDAGEAGLVLGYGTIPTAAIPAAVGALAAALEAARAA
jgi:GntR family transcriptional regulator/MocR family aminotransferase